MIQIKRIYEAASPEDGARVLVDRLWPRGVSKENAALTIWMKDVAPSEALREWFGHVPERMGEFAARYRQELASEPAKRQSVETLLDMAKHGTVTLLYGARDPQINQAIVLMAYLQDRQRGKQ